MTLEGSRAVIKDAPELGAERQTKRARKEGSRIEPPKSKSLNIIQMLQKMSKAKVTGTIERPKMCITADVSRELFATKDQEPELSIAPEYPKFSKKYMRVAEFMCGQGTQKGK